MIYKSFKVFNHHHLQPPSPLSPPPLPNTKTAAISGHSPHLSFIYSILYDSFLSFFFPPFSSLHPLLFMYSIHCYSFLFLFSFPCSSYIPFHITFSSSSHLLHLFLSSPTPLFHLFSYHSPSKYLSLVLLCILSLHFTLLPYISSLFSYFSHFFTSLSPRFLTHCLPSSSSASPSSSFFSIFFLLPHLSYHPIHTISFKYLIIF